MTRTGLVVLLVFGLSAQVRADPPPLSEADYETAIAALANQTDEPIGLLAIARSPRIGLEKGDLVRAINGAPAVTEVTRFGGGFHIRDNYALINLTVLRGKKELVVTLHVKPATVVEHTERDRFGETLDRNKQWGNANDYQQVTHDGQPTGVMVKTQWFMVTNGPQEGDIIRRIDGHAVTTSEEVATALEAARTRPQFVLDMDRLGQILTITVILDDPPKESVEIEKAIALIKKVNDTTYEVPKALIDSMLANPMAAAKSARVVPAMKDGKPDGFKLYAIRPSSVWAALGLQNGDTLNSVDGQDMTSADKALEVYTKLRDAKQIKLTITRHGKPLTITYKIK
jgi:type II secretory pathway component PulC